MICNSHSSWVLSLNLIDIFFLPLPQCYCRWIQCPTQQESPRSTVGIFTSIHNFLLQGQIFISFVTVLCIHPSSFLFCIGPSPTSVEVNCVCTGSFRDESGSTGTVCLKKLNEITSWNQGTVIRRGLCTSSCLVKEWKGKFTERLKGMQLPALPTSVLHYGVYFSPHYGEAAPYTSLPSPNTHTLWFSSSHQQCGYNPAVHFITQMQLLFLGWSIFVCGTSLFPSSCITSTNNFWLLETEFPLKMM